MTNNENQHISKPQVFLLMYTIFPESLLETMLVPLFPFMVRQYFLTEGSEKNIGYYTGLLASAFYSPLFVSNRN